jgi:hypothetical protein
MTANFIIRMFKQCNKHTKLVLSLSSQYVVRFTPSKIIYIYILSPVGVTVRRGLDGLFDLLTTYTDNS